MQPSVGLGFRAKMDTKVRGTTSPIKKITYALAVLCVVCCFWLARHNIYTSQIKQYENTTIVQQ